MLERKRFRRGCLLPVVVALIAAMAGAFAVASTRATANPASSSVTSKTEATITVTGVETGVTGKAYQYMTVKWSNQAHQPIEPVYVFNTEVATWMKNGKTRGGDSVFEQYIDNQNGPTRKFRDLNTTETRAFADALLAAIVKKEVKLTEKAGESITETGKSGAETDEDTGSSVKFSLSMGGYLIRLGNGSTCVYQPIASFVAPELTDRGYELKAKTVEGAPGDSVEAKSKKITSTKTVNNKTKVHSQIGDNLSFVVKTPVPNYPPKTFKKKFGVKDQTRSGLTVNTDSITVWIGEEELTKSSDYSVSTFDSNDGKHEKGFTVEFDHKQYETKLADAGANARDLIIKYAGTLNDKASVKGSGVENRAEPLIVSDTYDSTGKYTDLGLPSITTVYTYGIRLTKVDADDKEKKLSGARFTLHRKTSKWPSKNNSGTTEVKVKKKRGVEGRYIVAPDGTATFTSGTNGQVIIDGLSAADTYELTEIKAPDGGYALPNKSTTIDIRDEKLNDKNKQLREPDGKPDDTSAIGGWFVRPDKHNRLTFKLTNKKADFKLPRTGAIGAVIFGVFGAVLVSVSVAFVVAHRRKAKEAKRS